MKLSIFGGPAWSWHPGRQQWYLHHFLAEQPDLNFRNPAVQKEFKVKTLFLNLGGNKYSVFNTSTKDIIRFWLEDKKADGIRVDALANLVEDEDFRDEPIKNDPSVNPKVLVLNKVILNRPNFDQI